MKGVAVVICNYNKRDYVLNCIHSVFASSFQDLDVVVVDNASTDGSVEAISERFGDRLTLLVNKENLGGAGGFHRGMQYAVERGIYKYIHLLDNDVVLHGDAIAALYRFMEEHTEAGACGSLTCEMQQQEQIQEFGAIIDIGRLTTVSEYAGQNLQAGLPEFVVCDSVAACSAMYRTSVVKKAGIIDKDFFIYWDDTALCWEIRLAGYMVYACASSIAWHNGSSKERTAFSRYYLFRNKIYCFAKYLDEEAYQQFCEDLINRLFRMLIVEKNNPAYMEAVLHALNDALHNIRGKTELMEPLCADPTEEKLCRAFVGKKKILIRWDDCIPNLDRVINRIRRAADGELYLLSGGLEKPLFDGLSYVDTEEQEEFDIQVRLCSHILDTGGYDRAYVYMDQFYNCIADAGDFDYYESVPIQKEFFYGAFYGFLQSKLAALRAQIRHPFFAQNEMQEQSNG